MRIPILGDLHFGARGNSEYFQNKQREYFMEAFWPYFDSQGFTELWQLGDTMDNRKFLNVKTLKLSREVYFSQSGSRPILNVSILGNHDIFYNNTSEVNSMYELTERYSDDQFLLVDKPYTRTYGDTKIDFIPWINKENQEEIFAFIEASDSDMLIGHLELTGFPMNSGVDCMHGMDRAIFKKYKKVLSGHFHIRSQIGNVEYVGTPYQMDWADYNVDKGFYVLDTDTLEMEWVKTADVIFHKIVYDDEAVNYDDFNFEPYYDCFVKLMVSKKTDDVMYEKFVSALQSQTQDLHITDQEVFDMDEGDLDELDVDDSMGILIKSVDSMETEYPKKGLKTLLIDIHGEAQDLMENI